MHLRALLCLALLPAVCTLPAIAEASPAAPAPVLVGEAVEGPAVAPLRLPANTVLELEMVDLVSSEASKRGDFFRMRVAVAIVSGEHLLVPAGTIAVGQVVHAERARGGGKGGELILAARYLELPQGQVKLRSTFGAAGTHRVKTSLALAYAVGPLAMLVRGKRVEMPPGAALSARIAADTPISPAP